MFRICRPALRAALSATVCAAGASAGLVLPPLITPAMAGAGPCVAGITTAQADAITDNTFTGGGCIVHPNTTAPGDTITVTNLSVTATVNNNAALDIGNDAPPGAGAYTVNVHGSSLGTTDANTTGVSIFSFSGVTFDTSGGAANTFFGGTNRSALAIIASGDMLVKLGADTVGGATATGTGITIGENTNGIVTFDASGATISSTLKGVAINANSGAVNIGANGGLANTTIFSSGTDGLIVATDGGAVNLTLASSAKISGASAFHVTGAPGLVTVDSFGALTSTGTFAIDIVGGGTSLISLESGSVTTGKVQSSTGSDTLNIFAGANIANATFDGGTGVNSLVLTGPGTGSFDAASAANYNTITKSGSGTWNLIASATGISAAPITVSGGTLNINGAYTSTVSVASGGILGGTGKTGAVTVASGGTLAPGSGAPGALTINGALNMAAGAVYGESISSSATGVTHVVGAATINGTVLANVTTGSAFGKYTIIDATGGVTGTFSALALTSQTYRGALSYDANDVFLTLSANALTPLLNGTGNLNQNGAAGGIDAAVLGGASLPAGFVPLYGLSGTVLGNTLNQLTGEIGPDAAQSALEALEPFLNLMVETGQLENGANGSASDLPGDIKPARLSVGEMRVWGSGFGGTGHFGAQPVTGAQRLSTSNVGGAMGVETRLNDTLLIGGSAAVGMENFSLAGGQSQGASTDVFIGLYGRQGLMDGRAYVSGALAYGWHNVDTQRTVTVSGVDVLKGHFIAGDFGGRVEGGYNFPLGGSVLTPYAAFGGQQFSAPAYREGALSGTSNFALSFAAQNSGILHTELGARLAHDYSVMGDTLSLEGHAAWAHQIQDDVIGNASFQNLAGSNFVVAGAILPQETGIVGGGLEITSPSGIGGGARVDSQFGQGFSAVSGTVHIGYSW